MLCDNIKTERLVLRCLQADDAGWIAREIANPNVHRWLTTPPMPYRLDDAVDFLSRFAGDPGYRAIVHRGSPQGVISLGTTNGRSRELGYWLQESAWGQGLMSEAAQA